ncbi:MAG TPA: DUF2225 domain-containing protein [Planctomycetota bacterium]|nr:DUF2225 domain-containing protein [Planctomycetota bacterium]
MKAILAAALLGAAGADEKRSVEALCPVDGFRFTAVEILSTNSWGGRDADGCPHAFKTTPLEFLAWVCPSCGFAGLKKDFSAALSDEERRRLREGLKPAVPLRRGMRQDEIPGHVKFDLLAQTARLRGAPPAEVGRAYLYASWSARQQGAPALDDFEEWKALLQRAGLHRLPLEVGRRNRTELELEAAARLEADLRAGKAVGAPRALALYFAAWLYRRHGENADAARLLEALSPHEAENSVVAQAAARLRASLPLERAYQEKAGAAYAAAFESGALDPRTAAETAYLVGELHRRRGDAAAAAAWYDRALGAPGATPELKTLASAQKARLPR